MPARRRRAATRVRAAADGSGDAGGGGAAREAGRPRGQGGRWPAEVAGGEGGAVGGQGLRE